MSIVTWREYCEECGYSIGGLQSRAMAEHLMRIHNNSGSCPIDGAQIEEEPAAEPTTELDIKTDTNTNDAN